MSNLNNSNRLPQEYYELQSIRDLVLQQYNQLVETHANELNEFDEEFLMFLENQQQVSRMEETLSNSFITRDFEEEFGCPLALFPAFMTGAYRESVVTTQHSDRPTSVERLRCFEVKFNSLKDDDNTIDSFRATFRMDRGTFEWLVMRLEEHPELQLSAPNATPVYIQVAISLIRLANNHIGYRLAFNDWFVSYGSYTNFTRRVVKAIKGCLADSTIQWSMDYNRALDISNAFEYPLTTSARCFPGIIGALDGKNCIIRKPTPSLYGAFFRDRNNNYSIKLTAICDSECRFTYIRVGDSGRTHDAAAFHSSDVQVMIQNPQLYFPTDGFILADSAYPLSRHLIAPYPESECIRNSTKRQFNKMLSRSRMAIERAFGHLVSRWRFLAFHLYILDQMDINDIISACCILHNICIDRGEIQFPEIEHSSFVDEEESSPEIIEERNRNNSGRQRRDDLMVQIFGEDSL